MIRRNDSRGFALPTAIGALVIVAILVTAGFYTARQELRKRERQRHGRRLLGAVRLAPVVERRRDRADYQPEQKSPMPLLHANSFPSRL